MQITTPTFLEQLNPSQREAVTHQAGPLLTIAGPGSGKTRTVVDSIAYAIENDVMPDRILAFSFTVKASKELRHRVARAVGQEKSSNVWISTFHSFCRKVLKEDILALRGDYPRNFKALDESEQRKIVQEFTRQRRAQIDYLQYHKFPKADEVLNFIQKCKVMNIHPSEARDFAPNPDMSQAYAEIYEKYEKHLEANGAIDYTSQQLFTDALFKAVPEVKTKWQEKFELIFVDEYQDTDPVQYRIIKTLAEKHLNLRVVGDDDQGIYGFRGADIRNILNFEKDYPNAQVITLEENYRSTQQIVHASRALADFNPDRREKELFTTNTEGDRVKHLHCADQKEEAAAIAGFVNRASQEVWTFQDFAILCRTTRQFTAFEEAFAALEIPCQVVGESQNMPRDSVSIMTIHKSKGLEFPNVFVSGVCTDLLPHYFASEKEWDEELRLLYVAMTRAKNWLCLSSYDIDESFQPRGQSRFLSYIPSSLIERIESLCHTPIPSRREGKADLTVSTESSSYVDPLPFQSDITVVGVDPGISNVGWSITQKSSDGYTVHDYNTEKPPENLAARHKYIEKKINKLVASHSADAIAVEKLDFFEEDAKGEWFLDVAGCVALIRSIADQRKIECHLYTPQHVKYIATEGDRNASKLEVQKAIKRMCNLREIPEPDHSADAIAVSLCYLRNYLNSSRFQGNVRKRKHYDGGHVHLDDGQHDAAIAEFKKAINIDPIFTSARCSLGTAYLGQGNLKEAENAAKKVLEFDSSCQPAHELLQEIRAADYSRRSVTREKGNSILRENVTQEVLELYNRACAYREQGNWLAAENVAKKAFQLDSGCQAICKLLNEIKQVNYNRGCAHWNNKQCTAAVPYFKRAIDIDLKKANGGLDWASYGQRDLEEAKNAAKKILELDASYQPAYKVLKEIKQRKHRSLR